MIAYKLFHVRQDGSLGPLFINRKLRIELGKCYSAEAIPTKGYAFRPGWHVCAKPCAPHLSKKNRRWYVVDVQGNIQKHVRPESQGGVWYTADIMTVCRELERVPDGN